MELPSLMAAWAPGDIVSLVSALAAIILQLLQGLQKKREITSEDGHPALSRAGRVIAAGKWAAVGGVAAGLLAG